MDNCASPLNQQLGQGTTPAQHKLQVTQEARENLSRKVFDDLFESDLLGFLLSLRHFGCHLKRMLVRVDDGTAFQLQSVISSTANLIEFHGATLAMFSGAYIEECCHDSFETLMIDLDDKLKAATQEKPQVQEFDIPQDNIENMQATWQYRKACAGGDLLLRSASF